MIQPMKPQKDVDKFKTKHSHCVWSLKLDGVRVLCELKRHGSHWTMNWYSGNGKPLANFEHMWVNILHYVSPLTDDGLDHIILDGEMTAENFSHVMTQLRRLKDIDPSIFIYNVFDIASHSGEQLERIAELAKCIENGPIKTVPHYMSSTDDALAKAESLMDKGAEGIILKSWNGFFG